MAKRSRRSSHRRTKRHSTRSRRHHRVRHTRRRGKRMCGGGWPDFGVREYLDQTMRNATWTNHTRPRTPDYSKGREPETDEERAAALKELYGD